MTKDEIKDEIKNKISMALKDPILQQGFEIICKENAELNKKLSKAEADYDKMFWNKNEIISKAKEIIKQLVNGVRVLNDPKVELTDCDGFLAESEQFLNNEVEK